MKSIDNKEIMDGDTNKPSNGSRNSSSNDMAKASDDKYNGNLQASNEGKSMASSNDNGNLASLNNNGKNVSLKYSKNFKSLNKAYENLTLEECKKIIKEYTDDKKNNASKNKKS